MMKKKRKKIRDKQALYIIIVNNVSDNADDNIVKK